MAAIEVGVKAVPNWNVRYLKDAPLLSAPWYYCKLHFLQKMPQCSC